MRRALLRGVRHRGLAGMLVLALGAAGLAAMSGESAHAQAGDRSLPSVVDGFSALDGWRTVNGAWSATGGVLRGSGQIRRELCDGCGGAEDLHGTSVSARFKVPASPGEQWASVSLALYGRDDADRLWLTALPYAPQPRVQLIRATAGGETNYAETFRGQPLLPGRWYRLELSWRDEKAFARVWPAGTERPAAPLAGHVFDDVDFHPVAAGLRTYGLPSVDVDDFVADHQRAGAVQATNGRGGFAPVGRDVVRPPTYDEARASLPRPIIDGQPGWIDMYDKAWRILYGSRLRQPSATSPLPRSYLDEGFDPDIIFQWDIVFMTMFGRYMHRNFDAIGSLDDFYALQRPTGEIRRVYYESTGAPHEWGAGVNGVNPPLFAWAELNSYQLTGDLSRVRRVLPALAAYADWVSVSRWSQASPHQLYWNNGNGNGMDNLPREPGQGGDGTGYGHADMSCQMVVMWRSLAALYDAAGDATRAAEYRGLADAAAVRINQFMWDETDGRYYDVNASGTRLKVDTIAGFWALLAGVADGRSADRLAASLADPQRYGTEMPFPGLSRAQAEFDPHGYYWRGGVWPPTNYAVIKGLSRTGHGDLARDATSRYLAGMYEAFRYTGTLWEAYAPARQPGAWINASRTGNKTGALVPVVAPGQVLDPAGRYVSPASDEHGSWPNPGGGTDYIVKPDFVGWTGLGPIAGLIEDVIGIQASTPTRTIEWTLTRTDRHGVANLWLGDVGRVDLVAAARTGPTMPVTITATNTAACPLTLVVIDRTGVRNTVTVPSHARDYQITITPN